MKRNLREPGKRFNGRSQAGQSVVMLAVALLALVAFVGLVTDIALLFVRFSTLRRAVDAAAIAAADQICADGNSLDIVTAAYRSIELHGIGADSINEIFVETCETNPLDPELCPVKCDPAAELYDDNPDTCDLVVDDTEPPRKLVRITAQIESPTTFLRLIGWETITLEASAVVETAVVNLVLALDTSESTSEPNYNSVGEDRVNYIGQDRYSAATFGQLAALDGDSWFDELVRQPFEQVCVVAANFVEKLDFVRAASDLATDDSLGDSVEDRTDD